MINFKYAYKFESFPLKLKYTASNKSLLFELSFPLHTFVSCIVR